MIDYAQAAKDKEAGIQLALLHADSHDPQWMRSALACLHDYAVKHERFAGWMVSHAAGAPATAAPKAWGAVFLIAARLGWLEKSGYTEDPTRHRNPVPVWRSLLWK